MSKPKKKPPPHVGDLFPLGMNDNAKAAGPVKRGHVQAQAWTEARQRLAEIQKLIKHRHGGPCDTDDGRAYLAAAVTALFDREDSFIVGWARVWVPDLSGVDEVLEVIAEARARYERREAFPSSQEIGDGLCLAVAEREALSIRTIRPAGMTRRQFSAYAKARKAANAAAQRAAKGAKPRAQSAEQQEPWKALGMSRRTYYRRQAAGTLPTGGTVSSPVEPKALGNETRQCHLLEQTLAGSAMRLGRASRSVGAGGLSPGDRSKIVKARRSVELPLPGGAQPVQASLINDGPAQLEKDQTTFRIYNQGPRDPAARAAMADIIKRSGRSHGEWGERVGLSRGQFSNGIRPRDSNCWSPGVVEKVWAGLVGQARQV